MRRGTTPTITITTDVDLSEATNMFITFKQGKDIVMEKTLDDVEITENEIFCELTQEETLALRPGTVHFQIRASLGDSKLATNIMTTSAEDILKDGVI